MNACAYRSLRVAQEGFLLVLMSATAYADDAADFRQLNSEFWRQVSAWKFADMERTAWEMKALAESGLRDQPKRLADALHHLAYAAQLQGRFYEAEFQYKQSLAIKEKVLGVEHSDVAWALQLLANIDRGEGRYVEAEPLYKRTLAIREKVLGGENPDTVYHLDALAELYRVQGRYAEAEPLYKRALTVQENALGAGAPARGVPS